MTVPIRRALLSVSDKAGVVELARGLDAHGVALISTGGTARALRDAGLPVTDVSEVTGFPEIMDGRVKTLHPKIHGGLLARRGMDDAVMRKNGIPGIDLLVVNLYPFELATASPDCTMDEAVETIDIGGPAMLRAAAKNHEYVAAIVDPSDYGPLLETLHHNGGTTLEFRRRLAAKVFAHTSSYDGMIAHWLGARGNAEEIDQFPPTLHLDFNLQSTLRYGENPHQNGALYVERNLADGTVAGARAGGQGTFLQQHRRRRCGARMREGVREDAGVRDRQAR
jgi:phosphoribosylaminoimidazolecarboxamide formyltransferase/IMP cyclohydrolase